MPLRHIDSPQNENLKSIAKLRNSRGRLQQQRIIIDGTREVSRAIQCGVEIESIFLPANTLAGKRDPQVSSWIDDFDVCALGDRALAKIAFGHRMDIVAVASTPNQDLERLDPLVKGSVIAVLERMEKPGNVGAILRSADGAGLDGVVLVDPATDLFNPNAIRASLGTIFSVPVATASFQEYKAWSQAKHMLHLLAKCEHDARSYRDVAGVEAASAHSAIVLGSEAKGLSEVWDDIEHKLNITIPMRGIADSLNVASSAAILFYEIVSAFRDPASRATDVS